MTTVAVNTYTHSVTYVADNLLRSLKDIIRLGGLDPAKFVSDWNSSNSAIKTWLGTGDLQVVILEVYNPRTGGLVYRWDIDIVYGWSGEGTFYADTDQLKYHIRKAGLAPNDAAYKLFLICKPGHPVVEGWGPSSLRSTDGFVRHSLGPTIDHYGLGGNAAYWRKN